MPYSDPDKQREYQRQWCRRQQRDPNSNYRKYRRSYSSKTRRFVYRVKRLLRCCRCGFDDPRALDFHHRNPKDKSFMVSRVSAEARSISQVKEEMRKCDLICSNCHRIEHGTDYRDM